MKNRYEYGVCHTDRYNPELFSKNYALIENIAPQMLHPNESLCLVSHKPADSGQRVIVSHRKFDEYEGDTLRICDPYTAEYSYYHEMCRAFDPNNPFLDGGDIRCGYDFYILVDNDKKMVRVKGRWFSQLGNYYGWEVKSIDASDNVEEPCKVVEDDYDRWGDEKEMDINWELMDFLEWFIRARESGEFSPFAECDISHCPEISVYSAV